jgi:hypothetical protein
MPWHTCGTFASHQCATAHQRTLRDTSVCYGAPAGPSGHTCGTFATHQCATAHQRTLRATPADFCIASVCSGIPADPSRHISVLRGTSGPFAAHLRILRIAPMCSGTPIENRCSGHLIGCHKLETLLGLRLSWIIFCGFHQLFLLVFWFIIHQYSHHSLLTAPLHNQLEKKVTWTYTQLKLNALHWLNVASSTTVSPTFFDDVGVMETCNLQRNLYLQYILKERKKQTNKTNKEHQYCRVC